MQFKKINKKVEKVEKSRKKKKKNTQTALERNKTTDKSFITLFDRLQKSEKNLAALNLRQAEERRHGIDRRHQDNDNDELLLSPIVPVKKMLSNQLRREMHRRYRAHPCSQQR